MILDFVSIFARIIRSKIWNDALSVWCFGATVRELLHRVHAMIRLTINLTDRTHRALKEAAARQNRSMTSIIEESLNARGIQSYDTAREIVANVRAKSRLDADKAMALAVEETRRFRQEQ